MTEHPLKIIGRITLAMLGFGVGVGLMALFTWEWTDAIIIPTLGATTASAVGDIAPLVFLMITALSSPVVAGVLGIFEGLRSPSLRQTLFVGVGCLVGAALMIVVAGVFISFTGPPSTDGESATLMDLVGLAGMGSIASLLTGVFTTKFGAE